MYCSTPGLPVPDHLPWVCPSSCSLHQWCFPAISSSDVFFSFCPPSFPASETLSMSCLFALDDQNYWSFSFSISPSSDYSGSISIKIDWFDLLTVQGTFNTILQHHSSKASILWHSAFFTVQLSQPYVATGKTIALTIRTFVGRVMSLLSNTLSRFVIAFLPFWHSHNAFLYLYPHPVSFCFISIFVSVHAVSRCSIPSSRMFGHFDTMYVLDQLPLCCVPSVKFTVQLSHGLVFLFVIPVSDLGRWSLWW